MTNLQTNLQYKNVESQQLAKKIQTLEMRIHELRQALYESEAEKLQRDYDEFRAPDMNNDDVISADEFVNYITQYMRAYPDGDDYPTFNDFDQDANGQVTFDEWQAYLRQQQQLRKHLDEASAASDRSRGGTNKATTTTTSSSGTLLRS